MSDNKKRDESITKRKTKPEEEQKTGATSKPEGKKSQENQPSGGFKAGWLVGGSILILVLALLYTRNVEQGAQKKDHHPVRETEQTQTDDPDYKGLVFVQEKWKNVFRVEKQGEAVTLHTIRCTHSGPEAYDEVLGKVVKDIGEHINVKNFTLMQPTCKSITDRGVEGFAESVGKHLTKLESLEVTWMEVPNITDTGVTALVNSIKYLHNLKHLYLFFQGAPNVGDGTLKSLASAMNQYSKSLQNFSLGHNYAPKLTSEPVIEVAESIARNFPKLKDLKFTFRWCDKVTNTIVDSISKAAGNLKNLEGLDIALSISNIATKEIQAFTNNIAGLTNLKSLDLVLHKAKLATESLEVLANALAQNHNSLVELTLDFAGSSNVMDAGVQALAKALKNHLTNLKILNLGLMGLEYLTDEGVKEIASIFGESHKGLEELKIDLNLANKVTGVGIMELAKSIEKNLHNLQKFRLTLPSNNGIDDAAVKQVAAIFANPSASKLKEVGVWFKGSESLTNEGVSALAENIGNNLINLEKLVLELVAHPSVGDAGIYKVSEAIGKRLPKLKELEIRIAELKISEFAIAAFIESLGQDCPDFTALALAFEGLGTINDHLILQLTNTIGNHLRNLEKLGITLTLTSSVTDKGVKHIENLVLSGLPNLQELSVKYFKAYQVKNSAVEEFVANVAQKNTRINRLTAGFPQNPQPDEKAKLREKTKAIPFCLI